jgi:hypothetical protein
MDAGGEAALARAAGYSIGSCPASTSHHPTFTCSLDTHLLPSSPDPSPSLRFLPRRVFLASYTPRATPFLEHRASFTGLSLSNIPYMRCS